MRTTEDGVEGEKGAQNGSVSAIADLRPFAATRARGKSDVEMPERTRRRHRTSHRPGRGRRERARTIAFYALGLALTLVVTYAVLVFRGE